MPAYVITKENWPEFAAALDRKAELTGIIEALTKRPLGDGRYAYVAPLLFTSRICVAPAEDSLSVDAAYCYHSMRAAIEALKAWDPAIEPDPRGWHRKPTHARRRIPILCGECLEPLGHLEYRRP